MAVLGTALMSVVPQLLFLKVTRGLRRMLIPLSTAPKAMETVIWRYPVRRKDSDEDTTHVSVAK